MSVAINGTNGITYNDGSLQPSAPVGKNIIINGNMQIAQRATSTSSITNNGYHTVDRFQTFNDTMGTWTQSQSTTAPSGQGFATSLKMDCTTADASPSAADRLGIRQRFEGYNIAELNYGTASAQTTTLSFWVRSNKTGTYIAELYGVTDNRQISKSYTISSADTWEKKTITFVGDTGGTYNNDNSNELIISWYLGAGSDYTSGTLSTTWGAKTDADRAVGQVNLADSTSNEWYITGVQLEANTTATPFENLQYGTQLELCQRYYQQYGSSSVTPIGAGVWFTTTQVLGLLTFPVIMRTAPTITTTGTGWIKAYRDGSSTATGSGFFDSIANHSARFNMSGWDVAGTAGMGAYLQLVADKYIFISAEL